MSTIIIYGNLLIWGILLVIFGPRFYGNYKKKKATPNSYLIKNVESEKVIRPLNANIEDNVSIIQYTPKNWECVTWQMIEVEKDTYLLKNLYTQKSFQALGTQENGAVLSQVPIGGSDLQHWKFLENADGTFRIRLKNKDLYVTSNSDKVNEPIVLMSENGSDNQNWILKKQQPII